MRLHKLFVYIFVLCFLFSAYITKCIQNVLVPYKVLLLLIKKSYILHRLLCAICLLPFLGVKYAQVGYELGYGGNKKSAEPYIY